MNFQDVIRESYDSSNKALKVNVVAGSAAGSSTVFIGTPTLYAVVNTGGSAANVTLNPSPNFIGIVTVANPGATGNVTLDAGSKTQIVGNVTLTDSKGYIGLATVTPGAAWPDPKTYIGLVTVTGNFGTTGNVTIDSGTITTITNPIAIKGNLTLSDSKTYIGLTTSTIGNTPTVFVGTSTLFAVVNTGTANLTGNVTLDPGSKTGIVGNVTLTDSKGFIGLVTAVGTFTANIANVTLNASSAFIGLATVTLDAGRVVTIQDGGNVITVDGTVIANQGASNTDPWYVSNQGNVTLSDSKKYIGLVTSTIGNTPTVFMGTATLFAVVNTSAAGQASIVLDTGTKFIGLTTAYIGNAMVTVTLGTKLDATNDSVAPGRFYPSQQSLASGAFGPIALDNFGRVLAEVRGDTGNGDADGSNRPVGIGGRYLQTPSTYSDGSRANLLMDVNGRAQVIASGDPKTYIGLVTVGHTVTVGAHALTAGVAGIGFVTVKIDSGTQFIGLVTAESRNAGTSKTLVNLPILGLSKAGSIATIAIPTNSNRIKVTNMMLSSDATVNVRLKSGVTYLNGNASLGITLNPGGGWTYPGSPDSPSWIGLPSGALVIEKFDMTSTIANIGGNVIYFDEA